MPENSAASIGPTPPSSQERGERLQADEAIKFAGTIYRDRNESPLVTRCVPSGLEQCGDGIDNDCDGRYDDVGCGYNTGVLQWTLTWSGDADVNLSVAGPAGGEVSGDHPHDHESELTLDRTCSGKCRPTNVENVFVAPHRVPLSGTYLASVEVNRAPAGNSSQPIDARISGRIGRFTWHNDVKLAPFAGAAYRVTFPVGADADGDSVVDEHDACPKEKGCWFDAPKYRGCVDQDADSVPDQIDACPQKTGLSSDDPKLHGCPLEFGDAWVTNDGVKILKRIEFATGLAQLRQESKKTIADVARAIKSRPGVLTRMAVDGHTDGVGDETANVELSFKRATAVVVELVAQGTPGQVLDARGYGETKPLADNESEAGRQTNRRVEFVVLRPPPRSAVCW